MLYGIELDDDDELQDQEYVPTIQQEAQYEKDLQSTNKWIKQKRRAKLDVNKIWQEMNANEVQIQVQISALDIAKQVLCQQNLDNLKRRVTFAGKEFIINSKDEVEETETIDNLKITKEQAQKNQQSVQPQYKTLQELRQSFKYYHEVLKRITSKTKSVNSIGKSKLDWKEYKSKEKIEQKLDQHRKGGGTLGKIGFLQKAKELQRQKTKLQTQTQE